MYKLVLVGKGSLAKSTVIYVDNIDEFLEFLTYESIHNIQVFNKGKIGGVIG
jgi:hypothetical protein